MNLKILLVIAIIAIPVCAGAYVLLSDGNPDDSSSDPDNYVSVQTNVNGEISTKSVLKGSVIEPPASPSVMNGYVFVGWVKSLEDLNSTFDFSNPINSDVMIYALIAQKSVDYNPDNDSHIVQFKYNILNIPPSFIIVNDGQNVTLPDVEPRVENYFFDNWYVSTTFNPVDLFNPSVPIKDDTVIYGHYDIKKVVVTFSGNGGRVIPGMEQITVNYGETIFNTWNENELVIASKEGFIFDHWETSEHKMWNIKESKVTESMMLYAMWAEIKEPTGDLAYFEDNTNRQIIKLDSDPNSIYIRLGDIKNGVHSILSDHAYRGTNLGSMTLTSQWTESSKESLSTMISNSVSTTKGHNFTISNGITTEAEIGINKVNFTVGSSIGTSHEFLDETVNASEYAETVSTELSKEYGQSVSFGIENPKSNVYYAIVLITDISVYEKITKVGENTFTTELVYHMSKPTVSCRSSDSQTFYNYDNVTVNLLTESEVKEFLNTGNFTPQYNLSLTSNGTTITVPTSSTTKLTKELLNKTIYDNNLSKTGFTIKGWSINKPGNADFNRSCLNNYPEYVNKEGLDLYAIWVPNKCLDYTIISNEQELQQINNDLGGKYVLVNDVVLSNNWTPLGYNNGSYDSFYGTFNGAGFTIRNMNINGHYNSKEIHDIGNSDETKYAFIGMFSRMSATASVVSTVFEDVNINVDKDADWTCTLIGTVAGYSKGGLIDNIILNSGNITCSSTAYSKVFGGGIVGTIEHNAKVSDCLVGGRVNISLDASFPSIGGVVGCMDNGSSTVTYCHNDAKVKAIAYNRDMSNAGGIVGTIRGTDGSKTISYCLNINEVRAELYWGDVDAGHIVGRIFDTTDVSIDHCSGVKDRLMEKRDNNYSTESDKLVDGCPKHCDYNKGYNSYIDRSSILEVPNWSFKEGEWKSNVCINDTHNGYYIYDWVTEY